jgi:hypothetical protein
MTTTTAQESQSLSADEAQAIAQEAYVYLYPPAIRRVD